MIIQCNFKLKSFNNSTKSKWLSQESFLLICKNIHTILISLLTSKDFSSDVKLASSYLCFTSLTD